MNLRNAFQELWIYPFAVAGVLLAPVVASAALDEPVVLAWDWAALAVAAVITAAFVVFTELRGTAEEKKRRRIRVSRYAMAFLLGIFWRLVVPMIGNWVAKLGGG